MADSAVGGLAGVTVVVTRPLEGAGVLASLFERAGANTIVMPLIQLADVATEAEISAAIDQLGETDWVVATSVHAADRVAEAIAGRPVRVAAVGATTASVLPRVDLVPARQSAEGLLEVFPACDPPGSATVLVAQSADGATTLVDGLAARGWRVRHLHTHRPRAVVPSVAEQLEVLRADVVVFTSGSQVLAWREVFGDSTPPVVASIGPQTTRMAENAGMKVQVTASDHSLPGVVRAVERFLTAGSS